MSTCPPQESNHNIQETFAFVLSGPLDYTAVVVFGERCVGLIKTKRDSPCAVHVAFAGQAPSLKHLTICSHLSTFTAHLPFLPMINHKPAHAASACNASRFGSVLHMLLQMVVGNLGATGGGYFAERLGIAKTC